MSTIAPGSGILVTGASGAIGGEIAAQAAAAGAIVAVHGTREASVSAAIERLGARAPTARLIAAPADFREPGAIAAMVDRAAAELGRLDAVVHCAIAGAPDVTGPFAGTDPASYGPLAQNVLGGFQQLCFSALPHLRAQGGAIVVLAADSGRFAAPRQALLGAVNAGIMSFVRNLGLEATRDGVRVNCVSPSFVADTPIFARFAAPGGRAEAARKRAGLGLPTPPDIAPLVLLLCGPGGAKITGQVISVNGGMNA